MQLSRRGFLTAAGVTGMAAAFGLAGCSAGSAPKGANGDRENEPVDLSDATTVDADVVVVGTGTAGLVAATRAAELGAAVVVVEKLPEVAVGGCSRYTAGFAAFEASDMEGVEGAMSIDDYVKIQTDYHRNACNIDIVRAYADNSGPATDWLIEQGVELNVLGNVHQPVAPDVTDAGLTGPGLIDVVYAKAQQYGVDFRFETTAVELITDDDKVTGIVAQGDDGLLAINASTVVLATGGFGANKEMFEEKTQVSYDVVEFYGPDSIPTGDGIKMGLGMGSAQHHPSAVSYANLKLADYPGESSPENILFAKQQPLVWVNGRAKRFVSEELCTVPDWTLNGEAVSQQDKVFSVFDSGFLNHLATEGPWQGQLFTEIEEGAPVSGASDYAEAVVESSDYLCYKADTIEELAEQAGLDPEQLATTIDAYNSYCAAGADPEYGKNPQYLIPVTEGPFYCFKNKLAFYNTLGGLKIDDTCHVLRMEDGQRVSGLYAVGSDAGGAFGYYYNSSITPGEMQGWCLSSGFIVGNLSS